MKKTIAWITGTLLLLIGIGLAAYPLVSNYLNDKNEGSEVMSYLSAAGSLKEDRKSVV